MFLPAISPILKKRKVYESILVILNKPHLTYRVEEKCQLSENPEVEQREAKVKAHWSNARVAVSRCPATRPNECHEESPWWTQPYTRSFARRAHMWLAAPRQNIIVFHAQCIGAW